MTVTQGIDHRLLPLTRSQASLIIKNGILVFTKDQSNLSKIYEPEDIDICQVRPPELSNNMQDIYNIRLKEAFPNDLKRNGGLIGLSRPETRGKLILPLYPTSFSMFKCTLPWNDIYDPQLEPGLMHIPFTIDHVVITQDNHFIFYKRKDNRATWKNCFGAPFNFRHDFDKDFGSETVLHELTHGDTLYDQARDGIVRELNPYKPGIDSKHSDTLLEQIIDSDEVQVKAITSLTLHADTYDCSWHSGSFSIILIDAGEYLEKRNEHDFTAGRPEKFYSVEYTPDNMIRFLNENQGTNDGNKLATTFEGSIIMACVQSFGTDFLKKLNYEVSF
tara:strand:- start:9429 stop:10424 length:996 start_codon:yes stop_codon:yes gene_type:complete